MVQIEDICAVLTAIKLIKVIQILLDDIHSIRLSLLALERGLASLTMVEWFLVLTAVAYNLIRIPKLLAATG